MLETRRRLMYPRKIGYDHMIPDETVRTYETSGRTCDRCRFFHPLASVPGQGKCAHPDRRDQLHMVMVRRRELACRDRFDASLWTPVLENAPALTEAIARIQVPSRQCGWPKLPVLLETVEGIQ